MSYAIFKFDFDFNCKWFFWKNGNGQHQNYYFQGIVDDDDCRSLVSGRFRFWIFILYILCKEYRDEYSFFFFKKRSPLRLKSEFGQCSHYIIRTYNYFTLAITRGGQGYSNWLDPESSFTRDLIFDVGWNNFGCRARSLD